MEMLRSSRIATLLVVVTPLAGFSTAGASQAGHLDCAECDQVVARAVKALPQQPARIVVVDRDSSSRVLQDKIEEADGFVTTGENTVYLKKQGSTFRLALRGPGISDYAIAVIIWHEMAHIDGANEFEAQCREERLWQRFIVERRFDQSQGVRYLGLLTARHRGVKCPRDSRSQ